MKEKGGSDFELYNLLDGDVEILASYKIVTCLHENDICDCYILRI